MTNVLMIIWCLMVSCISYIAIFHNELFSISRIKFHTTVMSIITETEDVTLEDGINLLGGIEKFLDFITWEDVGIYTISPYILFLNKDKSFFQYKRLGQRLSLECNLNCIKDSSTTNMDTLKKVYTTFVAALVLTVNDARLEKYNNWIVKYFSPPYSSPVIIINTKLKTIKLYFNPKNPDSDIITVDSGRFIEFMQYIKPEEKNKDKKGG